MQRPFDCIHENWPSAFPWSKYATVACKFDAVVAADENRRYEVTLIFERTCSCHKIHGLRDYPLAGGGEGQQLEIQNCYLPDSFWGLEIGTGCESDRAEINVKAVDYIARNA